MFLVFFSFVVFTSLSAYLVPLQKTSYYTRLNNFIKLSGKRALFKRYLSSIDLPESGKEKTEIGSTSYVELVTNSTIFVDKSLLIKDFYEDSGKTLLMTYPRRWGKTMNLKMIKAFFSIETDKNGHQLPLTNYSTYPIFRGGTIDLGFDDSKTIKPLKIA